MKALALLILLVFPALTRASVVLYLDFNGVPAFAWDNRLIPATPAFTGDAAGVTAIVARNFASFDVRVFASDAPGVTGQSVRVIVGGDGAWYSPVATGVTNLFEIFEPTPTAFAFPLRLNNDVRFVASAISHELGHALAGLNHQSLWIDGVRVSEYRDGFIMGNGYTASDPVFGVGIDSAGQPQDDNAQLGAALGFAVPEPIWGTVAALGVWVLGRRRVKTHATCETQNVSGRLPSSSWPLSSGCSPIGISATFSLAQRSGNQSPCTPS